MKKAKPITIAITGPESTGKSWLAAELARHFNGDWVKEYAREYLQSLDRTYTYDDILVIAHKQLELIDHSRNTCKSRYLFLDTELTVAKIWCHYKYGRCHPWILEKQAAQQHDFYLLTDVDLPWQPDPLREHPDKREELFHLYRGELRSHHWPFGIVSGSGGQRLENAIRILKEYF